jgi:UDP-3-O-acyl-N-acetylglucosamine deacetylase
LNFKYLYEIFLSIQYNENYISSIKSCQEYDHHSQPTVFHRFDVKINFSNSIFKKYVNDAQTFSFLHGVVKINYYCQDLVYVIIFDKWPLQ